MPAKDKYHEAVKTALGKDGWTVNADPLHLKWGRHDFYVDLAANRFYLADKGERQIAIEVKSFTSLSAMAALEQALGQFLIYRMILKRVMPSRKLYLAVTEDAFEDVFEAEIGALVLEEYDIPVIVFEEKMEVILEWIEK